jgi:hypothetical protein
MSRVDGPEGLAGRYGSRRLRPSLREASAIAELSRDVFRRDVASLLPHAALEAEADGEPVDLSLQNDAPVFAMHEGDADDGPVVLDVFGVRHRLSGRLRPHDRRLLRAMGAVLSSRFHDLFRPPDATRLELYRATNEDHYVAAYIDPEPYRVGNRAPNRIVGTILTLRMAALSTYENRRVATGALLVGPGPDQFHDLAPAAPDALTYGLELTVLKSVHRLCDGKRTVYLVDRDAKLAGIVDVARFASQVPAAAEALPCARAYGPHARATSVGGHVCLVLTPNQEIKLFAEGVEAFAFAHGRWRVRDVAGKFATWQDAVQSPAVGRALFQAALNLAESRHGGLFVVVRDPAAAAGRLIARHDFLAAQPQAPGTPPAPPALAHGDPLAKRALHYLARGKSALELDPPVLEALASLDGALLTDRAGRLLAFGAILRHEASDLAGLAPAEGARTTAALVASAYGPVLKVSEDGLVSCFLDGRRVWEL